MRKIIITFIIFMMGVVIFFLLFQYNVGTTQRDGIQETFENASHTALMNTLDAGFRVTENSMSITDTDSFESLLQELFFSYSTVAFDDADIAFDFEYLVTTPSGDIITRNPDLSLTSGNVVKGVITRVTVDGVEHSVRHILDINE